jgi:hypothetical protein
MNDFEKYNIETKEKWGKTDAFSEHLDKTKNYSKDKWDSLVLEMDKIMVEFSLCMKNDNNPESLEAVRLVKMLQEHITKNYYQCTNEILLGLGQLYVMDERFRNNIDKHSIGTAQFICEAIKSFCLK